MLTARDMALKQRSSYQMVLPDYRRSSKLAVILHADIAGSTAMVQQDVAVAHERIMNSFQRFSKVITSYQGIVRELRGDALVAQFERASDAVAATLAFQENEIQYIGQLNDDIRPELRVGIALGEVIIDDHTVTGAGVVLAQRVEQLAMPGGLCITAAIHEALPQWMPLDHEYLGRQALKGFDEMIRAYRVVIRPGGSIPPPDSFVRTGLYLNFKNIGRVIMALIIVVGAVVIISSGYNHLSSNSSATIHWLAPATEASRQNPVMTTTKSIELGANVFSQNCVSCHGKNADGNGPNGRNLNPKPANLHTISKSHTDGEFAYKIRVGRGAMPSWEETLDETEIWSLVNYIKSLGKHPTNN
jgi:class 3 adenylate cyclase/mono/diheme cytochrome c family protein